MFKVPLQFTKFCFVLWNTNEISDVKKLMSKICLEENKNQKC